VQRLEEHTTEGRVPPVQAKALPMPFSQAIMDVVIPTNFMTPKITFTSAEDLEAHLTAFHAQMMISGGTDAMHYNLFMGTFTGTTLH